MKRGIDYIGVGVGAVILDSQGRFFMDWRGEKAKNERGLWEFPGGAVDAHSRGERLADALVREMREEFGIEIEVGELLDVTDHLLPAEGQHWVSPAYLCKITSGEPRILEPLKCSAIAWFFPAEVPANLTIVSRANLNSYLKTIK